MPMRGREEVKERKRESLRLFLWQNSIQDFLLMIFKSLSFWAQNPASKSQEVAFTTIALGIISFSSLPLNQPSPVQGDVAAMEAPGKVPCQAGGREQELDRALETTLSNPSLCTQGTERESDWLRVTQQIGD